jgi:hypothetical protein
MAFSNRCMSLHEAGLSIIGSNSCIYVGLPAAVKLLACHAFPAAENQRSNKTWKIDGGQWSCKTRGCVRHICCSKNEHGTKNTNISFHNSSLGTSAVGNMPTLARLRPPVRRNKIPRTFFSKSGTESLRRLFAQVFSFLFLLLGPGFARVIQSSTPEQRRQRFNYFLFLV